MREIFRTADPAEIAFLKWLFQEAGIPLFLFDEHASAMAIAWSEECRVMVSDGDFDRAVELLNSVEEEMSAHED